MMTTTARCFDSCCRGEYDGPTYVKLAERGHRAAKEHRCADCGETIAVGEHYIRTVSLIDGELDSRPSHSGFGACVLDQGSW